MAASSSPTFTPTGRSDWDVRAQVFNSDNSPRGSFFYVAGSSAFEIAPTVALGIAIMKLLERRPPESQSPDVSAEALGDLTRVSVSVQAFTPLSELQAGSPDASESVEVFRRTDRGLSARCCDDGP